MMEPTSPGPRAKRAEGAMVEPPARGIARRGGAGRGWPSLIGLSGIVISERARIEGV